MMIICHFPEPKFFIFENRKFNFFEVKRFREDSNCRGNEISLLQYPKKMSNKKLATLAEASSETSETSVSTISFEEISEIRLTNERQRQRRQKVRTPVAIKMVFARVARFFSTHYTKKE
jgi:hypothetical protein